MSSSSRSTLFTPSVFFSPTFGVILFPHPYHSPHTANAAPIHLLTLGSESRCFPQPSRVPLPLQFFRMIYPVGGSHVFRFPSAGLLSTLTILEVSPFCVRPSPPLVPLSRFPTNSSSSSPFSAVDTSSHASMISLSHFLCCWEWSPLFLWANSESISPVCPVCWSFILLFFCASAVHLKILLSGWEKDYFDLIVPSRVRSRMCLFFLYLSFFPF